MGYRLLFILLMISGQGCSQGNRVEISKTGDKSMLTIYQAENIYYKINTGTEQGLDSFKNFLIDNCKAIASLKESTLYNSFELAYIKKKIDTLTTIFAKDLLKKSGNYSFEDLEQLIANHPRLNLLFQELNKQFINSGTLDFNSFPTDFFFDPNNNPFGFRIGKCSYPEIEKVNLIFGNGIMICLPATEFNNPNAIEHSIKTYLNFQDFEFPFSAKIEKGKCYFSGRIRSHDLKVAVDIQNNDWETNHNVVFKKKYTNRILEITDNYGVIVLQVLLLNRNTIWIKGVFVTRYNQLLAITDNGIEMRDMKNTIEDYLSFEKSITSLFSN